MRRFGTRKAAKEDRLGHQRNNSGFPGKGTFRLVAISCKYAESGASCCKKIIKIQLFAMQPSVSGRNRFTAKPSHILKCFKYEQVGLLEKLGYFYSNIWSHWTAFDLKNFQFHRGGVHLEVIKQKRSTTSKLTINDFHQEDGGAYECRAGPQLRR